MLKSKDGIEERFKEIKDKVIKIIENIDNLDYSTKLTLLEKLVKRIYIKPDYSIKIEYNFEE